METAHFDIPSLNTVNRTVDLGSVLLGLSGVERVDFDETAHTVSVVYDPAYSDRDTIGQIIESSGYPSPGAHS